MSYHSMVEICDLSRQQKCSFAQVVLTDDCKERGVTEEESRAIMKKMWQTMLDASENYDASLQSKSRLVGGDGGRMKEFYQKHTSVCGEFVTEVIVQSLQMGESNACMKRIVAAPTAGSCGVLPAVLIPYYRRNCEKAGIEERMIDALYVAAGVGQVIASKAYIAGASGGCQAEIGSASAMAAAALTYLQEKKLQLSAVQPSTLQPSTLQFSEEEICSRICHAVAMSMKNLLGLVCDPVAGLVEVPCVKRNVIGAVNAISCADMAVAGIISQIPADQVIEAMKEIGDNMSSKYKETAGGGCAATLRGKEVNDSMQKL